MPDGRLGVVDYGAVARLPDGGLPDDHRRAAAPRGRRRLRRRARRAARAPASSSESITIDPEDLRDYLSPFVEPAIEDTFQFSREWMRGQFARLNDPRQPGFTTMLKINLPPDFLLIHRVWLGGIGVLSQLEAEAPFAEHPGRLAPRLRTDD